MQHDPAHLHIYVHTTHTLLPKLMISDTHSTHTRFVHPPTPFHPLHPLPLQPLPTHPLPPQLLILYAVRQALPFAGPSQDPPSQRQRAHQLTEVLHRQRKALLGGKNGRLISAAHSLQCI